MEKFHFGGKRAGHCSNAYILPVNSKKTNPKANVINNSSKVKNKEENAQDKIVFQQVVDVVNSNKKKEETATKHK